jgi:DnaJ-class molecular chaperone
MTKLEKKYLKKVREEFNWPQIVEEAKDQEVYEGGHCWVYLGSVFSLTPSGKYYQPWACSNLDECPRCKGTGHTKNPKDCSRCNGSGSIVLEGFISPDYLKETGHKVGDRVDCWSCKGSKVEYPTCSWCGGCGSQEAHHDEIYMEALEQVADEYGGYIAAGEGDPCDLFFVLPSDIDEDEEN